MEHLGHSWPWYALALVGVYRLTATGLDALVRRVVRTASQARAEHHRAIATTRTTAVPPPRGAFFQDRPRYGASADPAVPAVPSVPLPPTGHPCEEAR
ncbi:hypothetical protein ACWD6P_18705 [Streptomyces sp. NPDC002446]